LCKNNPPDYYKQLDQDELKAEISDWAKDYPCIEKISLYRNKRDKNFENNPKYVFVVVTPDFPPKSDRETEPAQNIIKYYEETFEGCSHIYHVMEDFYRIDKLPDNYQEEWFWFSIEPGERIEDYEMVIDVEPLVLYERDDQPCSAPSTVEPSTVEPSATEASTMEPSTVEPSTTEGSTVEPSTGEASTVEPSTGEPSATEASTTEASTVELSTVEPSTAEASTGEANTGEDIDDFPENHINSFTLKGEFWDIRYRGEETHIRNLERIRYIIHLLDNPGVVISSHRLVSLVKGNESQPDQIFDKLSEEQLQKEGLTQDEILTNGDTKEDYEKLKNDLRRLWERCITSSDTEKARTEWENGKNIAQNEYGIIVNDSGKDLKFFKKEKLKKEVENARSNVSKQIGAAIKDFEEKLSSLAEHLKRNISRGAVCIYNTDTENPISWNIRW